MKKFLARITPSCQEMTRLTSESMDRSLPWRTRLLLQIHYWICTACAEYRRQLTVVRHAMRRTSSTQAQNDPQLTSTAKARLKAALKAKVE